MFNRHVAIHALRDELRVLNADVVFLQEVAGRHERHAARHGNWPREPQHEFLADGGRREGDIAYAQRPKKRRQDDDG